MNDTPNPASGPRPAVTSKTVRLALIVSLAINLGVAGLAIGAFLHGGRDGRGDMVRDLGFGPYDEALRAQDRTMLKAAMRARAGDLQATRVQVAADTTALLAALRTEPFDLNALDAALAAQQAHLGARMKLGSDTMRDFLASLSQEDRFAFADRMEHHLRHGKDAAPPVPKD